MSRARLSLVCGGDSAEREVSLNSGAAVASALTRLGLEFDTYDDPRVLVEAAREGRVARVFNVLHGRGGEDGCLQGALALYRVPVTGSGVLGSALAMDKLMSKHIWRSAGLPTADWQVATDAGQADAVARALPGPWFVKPAREGSSVGMSRVEHSGGLATAISRALAHDREVLVERLIEGGEYTAAILDRQVLPLIRIATPREFYDYEAKYQAADTEYHCPSGIDAALENELAGLAGRAFELLGCRGWGRVDFMLDRDGRPWLLEANTVPGMTDHSLVPMAARAAGLEFPELVERILATAQVPA